MRITAQEYQDRFAKQEKQSKYKNQSNSAGDSKAERIRRAELELLEKQGKISNLRCQVKYELIPAQYGKIKKLVKGRWKQVMGCMERSTSYIADFVYLDSSGVEVVEDVKGVETPDYIIKRKLMLQVHGIKINQYKV
jgi:hypothetical protein